MKYRRFIAAAAALLTLITTISCGKDEVPESDKDQRPTVYTETTTKNSQKKLDWGDSQQNKQQQQSNGGQNMPQNGNNGGGMPNGNAPQGGNSAPPMSGNNYSQNNNNFWGNSNPNNGGSYNGGQSNGNNAWGGFQNNYYGGGFSGYNGGNNGGGSGQGSGDNNGNEQTQSTQPATQPPTAPTNNSSEPTTIEDNMKYTAEVTLGSEVNVKGSNVKVNGSAVTITSEGDYIFTGSLSNGYICVDTESPTDKVTIVLNGVDIANSNGPAILIDEAKKCTIKVKDGTANFLTSGGENKIYDGAIFSNDTLRLKGNGELYITSNNSHGISCDDDVIIDNGTYNIMSAKSGINVHDDITVNGGRVNIKGGTNGIKSKGTININGGCTMISGGYKEEKRSIYAMGTFSYTGGYVFAAGNQVSVPTYSERPYVIMDLVDPVEGGSTVEMVLNDVQMATFVPHTEFRSLMMLAPEITSGSTFYAVINGEATETFTIEEGLNLFTTK